MLVFSIRNVMEFIHYKGGNMTLAELKAKVQSADENIALPKKTELLKLEIVVQKSIGEDVKIKVFKNGYVLFSENRHVTVFRLHSCNGYEYKFLDNKAVYVDESFFDECEWYYLPLMIGMYRVDENRKRILSNHKVDSYNVKSNDDMKLQDVSTPSILDLMILNETLEEIRSCLNDDRKWFVIKSYFYDALTQSDIANSLGVRQQYISKVIKQARKIIKSEIGVEKAVYKRIRNKK